MYANQHVRQKVLGQLSRRCGSNKDADSHLSGLEPYNINNYSFILTTARVESSKERTCIW